MTAVSNPNSSPPSAPVSALRISSHKARLCLSAIGPPTWLQPLACSHTKHGVVRLYLCGYFALRLHLPQRDPGILRGGKRSDDCDSLQQTDRQQSEIPRWHHLRRHDDQHGEDLETGIDLAQPRRAEVPQHVRNVQQRGDEQDAEVAAEDEHGDIARDHSNMREDKKECAEQRLVRDGIEKLAERCALLQDASEQTIQSVRDAGQPKKHECEDPVPVENLDDQKWNCEQPQHRQDVGQGADLSHLTHRWRFAWYLIPDMRDAAGPGSGLERLLEHHRNLRLAIPVAQIKAMRCLAGTTRGNANLLRPLLAAPVFGSFAEPPANACAAYAITHDQAANEAGEFGLQMVLERNVDPGDDLAVQFGDICRLLGAGIQPVDPPAHLVRGAVIAQLCHQLRDSLRVVLADGPNVHLSSLVHPCLPLTSMYDRIGLALASHAAVH